MGALWFLASLSSLSLAQAASSSAGIGDYVAQGVGMGSPAQSIAGTQPVSEGVLTVGGTVLTATKLENGDILVANQTIHPSGTSTGASVAGITGTGSSINGSVDVNGCYSSWDKYWSASHASEMASFSGDNIETIPTTTWTVTGTNTYPGYKAGTSTVVTTIDTTIDIVNGGFTISTQTIVTTSSTVVTQTNYPGTTETYTNTGTWYLTSTIKGVARVPPKPTCKLPSVVPDCQSKWEGYITSRLVPAPTPPPHCDVNAGFLQNTNSVPPCAKSYSAVAASYYSKYEGSDGLQPPLCTAASIGGALCQSVRDQYQLDDSFAPTFDDKVLSAHGTPFFFNQGTQGLFNGNSTYWTWPTSSTMNDAPSCTLGCGRCAVTGGTVQLIYWPATATATQSNNASVTARATPPPIVTIETLGTTFTSPTLYISYRSLYASNACGGIGTEIGETILAIPPDKPLSSVYADTVPCDAHFRPTQVNTFTAPFTVEDLHEPVPYSIYSSQPWCQTYLRNHGCTGTCPTTAAYKPILVVNNDLLRGLQDDWSDCWGDIRGVYDPPLALTEAKSEETPQNTYGGGHSAAPATGPSPNTAAPTAEPDNTPDGEARPSVPKQPDSPTVPHKSDGPTPAQTPDRPQNPTQQPKPAAASPSDPKPTIVNVDPQAISLSPVEDHSSIIQVANGDHTTVLTAGAPAVTVGGQVMSVASTGGGIIVGTGNGASTIDAVQAPTVATVHAQALTMSEIGSGGTSAVQIVNGGTTETLTPGGSAVTIGSQIVSAASSGKVVVGTGSTASTVDVAAQSSRKSSSSSTSLSSTTRTTRTSSNQPSGTTAASSSSSSAAANHALASSGAFMIAVLFGVVAL